MKKFARATGDLQTLSKVDRKLIALTYTLEAQVHGTEHLRDVPPPIQTVTVKRLPEKDLPGWGSNVANLEEWEALEDETEEKTDPNSKILPLKDLDMNILPSDTCSEAGSLVLHQEGERRQKTEVKLEGKMVVEGVDASKGECDDEDAGGAWRPAVSKSTHRKYLRRKAKWEHYSALAEQDMQQDLEADKAGGNMTENSTDDKCAKNDEDLSSVLKDTRLAEDSLKSLQEETSAETALSDGEDDIEAEGIDVASEAGETFEASSVADDGSSEQSWSLRALSESSVACITGDFAMQNVILQMGLRLLAPGGMQIRQLNRYTL